MYDDIYNPEERNKLYFELIQSIIHYIRTDLNEMCRKLEIACFPILMSICADIDFLGGLAYSFKKNDKERSKDFINEYMGNENSSIYKSDDFACYLIDHLRNKLVHEAFIYGHFETSKSKEYEKYHLSLIKYREDIELLFIHPNKFKEDFYVGMYNFEKKIKTSNTFKNDVINNFSKQFGDNMFYVKDFPSNIKKNIKIFAKTHHLPRIERHSSQLGTSVITSTNRNNDEVIKFITNYYLRKNN